MQCGHLAANIGQRCGDGRGLGKWCIALRRQLQEREWTHPAKFCLDSEIYLSLFFSLLLSFSLFLSFYHEGDQISQEVAKKSMCPPSLEDI